MTIDESDTYATFWQLVPASVQVGTTVPFPKLAPVMDIFVPPVVAPDCGLMLFIVGAYRQC